MISPMFLLVWMNFKRDPMDEDLRAFAALVGHLLAERWHRTCHNTAQEDVRPCRAGDARRQGEALDQRCLPRTTSSKTEELRPEDGGQ